MRALGLSLKRHHSLLGALNVKLAYMPSCIRPEVRLTPNQRILCSDVQNVLWLARQSSLILYCTAAKYL